MATSNNNCNIAKVLWLLLQIIHGIPSHDVTLNEIGESRPNIEVSSCSISTVLFLYMQAVTNVGTVQRTCVTVE